MTVSANVRKAGPFPGNAVTTDYPFTFKCFSTADVRVVLTDTTGAETDLTEGSHYSVTLNADQDNNPGGSVHYPLVGSPLAGGLKLTLGSQLPEEQGTDIQNAGGFLPEVIEEALDYQNILVQQHTEQLTRTLVGSISDPTDSLQLPAAAARAGKILAFDSSGKVSMSTTLPAGSLTLPALVALLTSLQRSPAEIAAGLTLADSSFFRGKQARYSTLADAIAQQDHDGDMVQSSSGGIRVRGTFGAGVRPEAQIITENTTTSGHVINTQVNNRPTDEAAFEVVGLLSNGGYTQQYAQFVRWLNDVNTYNAYESLWGMHLTGFGYDNNPINVWARNSVQLCAGDTSTLKWLTPPPANWVDVYTSMKARTSLIAGDHAYSTKALFAAEVSGYFQVGDVDGSKVTDNAVQIFHSSGAGAGIVQAWRNSTAAYNPLQLWGSSIKWGGGALMPYQDNAVSFGDSTHRPTVLWAVSGTISTSDKTQKTVRGDGGYTDAEHAWAVRIRKAIVPYQWNDALAAKGDAARWHFGVLAQDVEQYGREVGIDDPLRYAFLCRDPLVQPVEKRVPVQRQATEEIVVEEPRTEVRDGRVVRFIEKRTVTQPKVQELPVWNEDGTPAMVDVVLPGERPRDTGLKDRRGNPIIAPANRVQRQLTASVPVMETVEEAQFVDEPVLDEQGQPVYRYGIRYEQLAMFLLGASL